MGSSWIKQGARSAARQVEGRRTLRYDMDHWHEGESWRGLLGVRRRREGVHIGRPTCPLPPFCTFPDPIIHCRDHEAAVVMVMLYRTRVPRLG